MNEQNPGRPDHPGGQQTLETLQDIKRMMERSSRFISLSGLSGIAAGICGLVGAWFANKEFEPYYRKYDGSGGYAGEDFQQLKMRLLIIALAVLAAALVSAFYFTWRKARHNKLPVWDLTARRLTINLLIPLVAGGLFILAMYQYNEWKFIAPACLIFYGLALVNASKFTLTDVRYLGLLQILLGLISTQFPGYGLYFWTAGFGVLHIIYGFVMWWKYEKNN
ncbi:MAG TPA: hypothetical protein VJ765_09775 [Chitinophagaceae bacterium]|nr:hypothetical protein [Chitinophagaceae bacterium]